MVEKGRILTQEETIGALEVNQKQRLVWRKKMKKDIQLLPETTKLQKDWVFYILLPTKNKRTVPTVYWLYEWTKNSTKSLRPNMERETMDKPTLDPSRLMKNTVSISRPSGYIDKHHWPTCWHYIYATSCKQSDGNRHIGSIEESSKLSSCQT